MIRLLVQTTAAITTLVLILASVRVVGGLNKPPALALFETKQCSPQPCWHGIRPGETALQQAETILSADRDLVLETDQYQLCWNINLCWNVALGTWSGDSVSFVNVVPPPDNFRLGDAMLFFGDPVSSNLCWIAGPSNGNVPATLPRPVMIAYISFQGNIKVAAYNPRYPNALRFDPEMKIIWIQYQAGYTATTPHWQGFTQVLHLGCRGK